MKLTNILKPSNRSLVRELVISDFKLRYKNSVLGYLWSLLKPLMLFGVLYVVFTKIVKLGGSVPHFPAYLLLGLVIWTFFVEATVSGMNSIMSRGDMIRKVSIPKYTIVVSTTISALINFILNMFVVAIFMIVGRVPFHLSMLLAVFVVGELVVFCLGVSFLLAALMVKFRDISHIWEVVLQVLFYATPIIYPLTLPSAKIAKIISISPLAQIIQDIRALLITPQTLTTKAVYHSQLGRVIPITIVIIVVVLASWYFKRSSRNFAEEI